MPRNASTPQHALTSWGSSDARNVRRHRFLLGCLHARPSLLYRGQRIFIYHRTVVSPTNNSKGVVHCNAIHARHLSAPRVKSAK